MTSSTISPDGLYRWDGYQWVVNENPITSEDGAWIWNGHQWVVHVRWQPNQGLDRAQWNHGAQVSFVARKSNNTKLVVGIVVAVFMGLIIILAGFMLVILESGEGLFGSDNTPEFGFRDDVNSQLYEDLGANRGVYTLSSDVPDFSSTVMIYGEDKDGTGISGSGVALAERWVLTAAHVVDALLPSTSVVVVGVDWEDPDAVLDVSEIFLHPGWATDSEMMEEGMDLALIKLSTSLDSNKINFATWDNQPTSSQLQVGASLFISGYGSYDEGISECTDFCLEDDEGSYSQRRAWANTLDRIVMGIESSGDFQNDDVWQGGFVAYDFDSPSGNHNTLAEGKDFSWQQGDYSYLGNGPSSPSPLGLEGTSVAGDSGGPIFAKLNNQWTVVGITSHGSPTANYGDVAVNIRVASHVGWICSHDAPSAPLSGC